MNRAGRVILAALLHSVLLLPCIAGEGAEGTLKPMSSAAGPDALTALIYDSEALPFSLLDVSRLVGRLLSRVDTRVVAHELGTVTAGELTRADYIVLLGVKPWPETATVEFLTPGLGQPVLAIGGAMGALARAVDALPILPSSQQANFVQGATLRRGEASFSSDLAAVFPVTARESSGVEILAEVEWEGQKQALAGRAGRNFWFSALPMEAAAGFIFSDIILDFYGVEAVGDSGILCLIDGVRNDGSAPALKRASDLLSSLEHPFAVSFEMPRSSNDSHSSQALSLGLRYAQARGGRVFLAGSGNPWWNAKADRPLQATELAQATAKLVDSFDWAVENSLFPLGLRLPDSGLSEGAAESLFPTFRVALGIAQASDASASATFTPASLTRLSPGMIVLPVSLWFQGPEPTPADLETARNLLRLRGTVLGVAIPAWQPFPETENFLRVLFALEFPFLDPVDVPVAVSTKKALLLTAASPPVEADFRGRARVRIFDREANEISNEVLTLPANPPWLICPDGAGWLLATPAL